MIFSSRSIVGTGGFDFVFEVAEVVGSVVAAQQRRHLFVPMQDSV
jgi:hypothetical protein